MSIETTNTEEPRLVLYVEDNPDHADLVQRSLARHSPDARILHVQDGEAALDYLTQSGASVAPRPFLILLDLRLPKIDGIDVLRTVKATPRLASIPVVVLTTSASQADVEQAYEHRVNSYLVKPDDFSSLDEMVKELGLYWLVWNTQPSERH